MYVFASFPPIPARARVRRGSCRRGSRVDHFSPDAAAPGDGGQVDVEDGGRRRRMDVVPRRNRRISSASPRGARAGAAPLGVVRPDEEVPSPRRTRPGSGGEVGADRMFCRFGSEEESRPVAACVWESVVDPAVPRVDLPRQDVDVRGADLRDGPVFEHQRRDLVEAFQALQDVHIGGVAGLGPLAGEAPASRRGGRPAASAS